MLHLMFLMFYAFYFISESGIPLSNRSRGLVPPFWVDRITYNAERERMFNRVSLRSYLLETERQVGLYILRMTFACVFI